MDYFISHSKPLKFRIFGCSCWSDAVIVGTRKGTAFNCVVELSKLPILTIRPRQEDCWFGVYNIPSVICLCRCWFSTVDVQTHFQTCPRPAAVETFGRFTAACPKVLQYE